MVLFEWPEEVLQQRVLGRAATEGHSDDTVDVIRKRVKVFSEQTCSVAEHYEEMGKLRRIDATKNVGTVYESVKIALGGLLVSSQK